MSKITVVIPCYNQGKFIEDSINSVLTQTMQDFEIIVMNDGSTDQETIHILKKYHHEKVTIFHTENQGLIKTCNFAISKAKGDYIVRLDADDKIASTYLELASIELDKNPEAGIVYSEAEFFGAKQDTWHIGEYNFPQILARNCIFSAAMHRKRAWEQVNGYNENMAQGFEDWNFWIDLIKNGAQVVKIPKILFYYRKHKEKSRNTLATTNLKTILVNALIKNHLDLYLKYPETLVSILTDVSKKNNNKFLKYKKLFKITLLYSFVLTCALLVQFL